MIINKVLKPTDELEAMIAEPPPLPPALTAPVIPTTSQTFMDMLSLVVLPTNKKTFGIYDCTKPDFRKKPPMETGSFTHCSRLALAFNARGVLEYIQEIVRASAVAAANDADSPSAGIWGMERGAYRKGVTALSDYLEQALGEIEEDITEFGNATTNNLN